MSSPRSKSNGPAEILEGTRVVLKEITASLQNSPVNRDTLRKSDNDTAHKKLPEHAVKVQFAREFADVKTTTATSLTESLSSASSFQSLGSTLSLKSSSGICADSSPSSPGKCADTSYINSEIPGLDDIIAACADIKLTEQVDQVILQAAGLEDLSQDQTFTSAADDLSIVEDPEKNLKLEVALEIQNLKEIDSKKEISQNQFLDSAIPLCPEKRLTKDNLNLEESQIEISLNLEESYSEYKLYPQENHNEINFNFSNQISKTKSTAVPPLSSQNLKETLKVSDKSVFNSIFSKEIPQESTLDSTFSINPEVIQLQISEQIVKNTESIENNLKDTSQCSPLEKIEGLLQSPIPQSILDKVVEQQKSLDATFAVDLEDNQAQIERPASCNASKDAGEIAKELNLFSQTKTTPKYLSFATLPSAQQNNLNSTIVINTKANSEFQETEVNKELNLSTTEKFLEVREIAETPSSGILISEKSILDFFIVIPDQLCKAPIPVIKVFSPEKDVKGLENSSENSSEKSFLCLEDNTLKKSNSESDSLRSTVNEEIQETSPAKVHVKDTRFQVPATEVTKNTAEESNLNGVDEETAEDIKNIKNTEVDNTIDKAKAPAELDSTVILDDTEIDLEESNTTSVCVLAKPEKDYETFKPQKQSTDLSIGDPSIFDKVELEAQAIAKEIYNKSLEFVDDNEQFISATSDLFQDPTSFDFLLSQGSSNRQDQRFESLYVKFDPLLSRSMLPQGNSQTEDEEQNGKNETPVLSVDTPKRNPALAAIDRLLFYSPISTGNKTDETKDIKQEAAEKSPQESTPIVDENMAKELELVRSLVVQLEEKLEKLKKEHEDDSKKHMNENKKHQEDYKRLEEKNSKLEQQLSQEIESKKQVTVVLDEYEKSISRLVAERERDRADIEEKAKLKEELQAANHHLSNTEAAFNDVHLKYERLKGVVAAYKSNELVLKESVQENVETIKALENRYEQLKSHAMAQLEKANQELEGIRKQHEAEMVKLQAMLKKAELKSKSLSDLVDQKTKENKELTQILDEVIARVGSQNSE